MSADLRRLGRGIGALLVLALLLAGIPVALWVFVGWPLPHSVPSWADVRSALTSSGVGDDVIVKGLALVCWVAWSVLAASVAAEVAGVVRCRGSRRIPLAGPFQVLAANLVAAVVLTLSPAAPRTSPSPPPLTAVLSVPRDAALVAEASTESCDPVPASSTVAPAAAQPEAPERYTVKRRDTLWGIAEAKLGDPFRWPELFELNRGRPQADGRSLGDPNLIRPGWVLELPTVSASTTKALPPNVNGSPQPGASSRGVSPPTTPPPSTTATTTPTAGPVTSDDRQGAPTTTPADGPRVPGTQHELRDPGSGIDLPGGSFVGLSLAAGVSASLVAALLHRRRRRVPEPPGDGITLEEPLATDAVRQLRRADLAKHGRRTGDDARGGRPSASESRVEQRAGGEVAVVSVGDDMGQARNLDVLTAGGVGLSGAGAPGVARSIILDFVTNASAQRAEVVIAGPALADRLFPDIEPFPGVEVFDDVEAAVTRLEVELVHRTRLIDDNEDNGDESSFTDYIKQNPAEPVPVVLLVADEVRGGLRLRLDAVATVGRRLGIGVLSLSPPPGMPTITVDGDGSVQDVTASEALNDLRGAHLFSLVPSEARELLGVVAAGRGESDAGGAAEIRPEPFPIEETSAGGNVVVHLLGTYRIVVDDEEIRSGLRTKARELLAFLLLHPQGKSVEAAVDAIWPDVDLARGTEGFRTAVGNLRKVLRTATKNPKAQVVEKVGERYRLEISLFDCDVWRLESALRSAKLAEEEAEAIDALELAARELGGDLLDGAFYEWVEAPREDLRRRSVDALVKLSELRAADGANDAAAEALAEAARLDPYSEDLYRRLMALQIALGQRESAMRTYKHLEGRLSELDLDPDEQTTDLLTPALVTRRPPRSASDSIISAK